VKARGTPVGNGRFETKNEADIYVCGYYRSLQMTAFLAKTEPEQN
jgi:hypothetical protein